MSAEAFRIVELIVPGLVIAIAASILTVRLSIKRFHAEKWWERKEEAYSSVLSIIHGYHDYTVKHIEDAMDPGKTGDSEKKAWEADWRSFNRKYAKARNLAALHLSEKALLVLDAYDVDKRNAMNDGDYLDWMESDRAASKKCLDNLIDVAKEDLEVK